MEKSGIILRWSILVACVATVFFCIHILGGNSGDRILIAGNVCDNPIPPNTAWYEEISLILCDSDWVPSGVNNAISTHQDIKENWQFLTQYKSVIISFDDSLVDSSNYESLKRIDGYPHELMNALYDLTGSAVIQKPFESVTLLYVGNKCLLAEAISMFQSDEYFDFERDIFEANHIHGGDPIFADSVKIAISADNAQCYEGMIKVSKYRSSLRAL